MRTLRIAVLLAVLGIFGAECAAQSLGDLARQKERERKERLRVEKDAYEEACKAGTPEAFDAFLARYPKSRYAPDIRQRNEDFRMWDQACRTGTKSAYRDYINRSKHRFFADAANDSIAALDVREQWVRIMEDPTIAALDSFIMIYPDAAETCGAKAMRSELMAEEYFARGNMDDAYAEFIKAGGRNSLKEENKPKYDKAAEHVAYNSLSPSSPLYELMDFLETFPGSPHYREISNYAAIAMADGFNRYSTEADFTQARGLATDPSVKAKVEERVSAAKAEAEAAAYAALSPSSPEADLREFMRLYPSSVYYNQVSDYLAIQKARALNMYSSEYAYSEALRYARTPQTVRIVNQYISSAKKSRRQENARRRAARWREDGGVVNICWEFLDAGVNLKSPDYCSSPQWNFNMGLGLRVGNYRSIVQFEVGVKPGVMLSFTEDDSYYTNGETTVDFFMPVYAKLKLNLGRSHRCNAYLAGTFLYNAVRNDDYQRQFSVMGGFGVQWKVFDWQILYYRQDFGARTYDMRLYGEKNWSQFLGTSMACYFRL